MAFTTPTAYYTNSGALGSPWAASTTASVSVTASTGQLVVVIANFYGSARTFDAITDNVGGGTNTYTLAWKNEGSSSHNVAVWASKLAASITSVSVTISGVIGSGFDGICALVWDGPADSPLDQTVGPTVYSSNTGSMTTGTTSATTQNDEVAIAVAFTGDSNGLSASGSGYTDLGAWGNSDFFEIAYKILTTTGTQAATFTLSTARTGVTGLSTYKAAAGSTSPVPRRLALLGTG